VYFVYFHHCLIASGAIPPPNLITSARRSGSTSAKLMMVDEIRFLFFNNTFFPEFVFMLLIKPNKARDGISGTRGIIFLAQTAIIIF
jgi:hypothetical protein